MKESEGMRNNLSGIFAGILTVLGLMLSAGVQLVFHACGAHEDGSYMSCHWAQVAVVTMGVVITVTGIGALMVRDRRVRQGIAVAAAPSGLAAAALPNILIRLCMMDTMHCNRAMRPAAVIFGLLAAVTSVLIAVFCVREAAAEDGEKM